MQVAPVKKNREIFRLKFLNKLIQKFEFLRFEFKVYENLERTEDNEYSLELQINFKLLNFKAAQVSYKC